MQNAKKKQKEERKERATYHHGDLRAGLVEATRRLVEEKGPDRFSVSDACRAAGVSTAAPYRHFTDREEMLTAVVMEGMDRFYEALRDGGVGHIYGSIEAIIALGQAYVDFAASEPGVFRLIFGLSQRQGPNDEKSEKGMRVYGVLLGHLAAYFGREEVDEFVRQRAFPLWTMVHGLAFLLIDDMTRQMHLEVVRDEVIDATTRKLLAE